MTPKLPFSQIRSPIILTGENYFQFDIRIFYSTIITCYSKPPRNTEKYCSSKKLRALKGHLLFHLSIRTPPADLRQWAKVVKMEKAKILAGWANENRSLFSTGKFGNKKLKMDDYRVEVRSSPTPRLNYKSTSFP